MKALGFLVSLLAHLVFLLLLVKVQFPVPEAALTPQIIQIVPMSPPRPAPPLVYVRPFVLEGGGLRPRRWRSFQEERRPGSRLPRA